MTIKQAFEKLTATTAAAMKNPFFVMRKLHDAFADIADKIVDSGGSTVTVEAVLTEGTKIATVTIDGDDTDLYAPASNSQDYSPTEHVIGKWIDGTTDVYEKTIAYTPESSISGKTAVASISNTEFVLIHEACAVNSAENRMWLLPVISTDVGCESGTVYLYITNDTWSTDWTFYVTVRYVKTTS